MARGIEVACLIRRLKEHVDKLDGQLVCVGTSATVKGDELQPVAAFATELFGETFLPEHICTEQYQPVPPGADLYMPPAPAIQETDVQKLRDLSNLDLVYDFCLDYIAPDDLVMDAMMPCRSRPAIPLPSFWGWFWARNALFRAIEGVLVEPCSLDEVTCYLQTGVTPAQQRGSVSAGNDQEGLRAGCDDVYLRREVEAYLLLGAKAQVNGQPLIRPKVHIFWRGLQGFYRCTNGASGALYTEMVDTCEHCHARCLPVEVCRNCGQDFYRAYAEDAEADLALLIAKTQKERRKADALPASFVLVDEPQGDEFPIHFTYKLYDNAETSDEESEEEAADRHSQEVDVQYCPACGKLYRGRAVRCDCSESALSPALQLAHPNVYLDKIHKCPACEGTYGGGAEVVTPLAPPPWSASTSWWRASSNTSRPSSAGCWSSATTARTPPSRPPISTTSTASSSAGSSSTRCCAINEPTATAPPASIGCASCSTSGACSTRSTRPTDAGRRGRVTHLMRKPENPDDVAAEHRDIQMAILSEIAKPGSRRVSLEGIGLLAVHYYKAELTLEQVAHGATKLQEKWRLSDDELYHLLATLLNEMRLKRAFSHAMLLTPLEKNQEQLFGRYNLPVGFTLTRSTVTGVPYRTLGFTSLSGGQTSLMNFVGKIVGRTRPRWRSWT